VNWTVRIKKKVQKKVRKLPQNLKDVLESLVVDLEDRGPVRGDWPNYSKLSDGSHHCHLNYSYVAVWIEENRQLNLIEVVYVGSREDAPY